MTKDSARTRRPRVATGARPIIGVLAALVLSALPAQAIEVANLEGFEDIFGTYAPGGDCTAEPQIVISRQGFLFTDAGLELAGNRMEFAASFWGARYDGIMNVFFPLVAGPDDLGPIILTANDDEKPGHVRIEASDRAPSDPFLAALVDTATFQRCKR